MDLLPSTTKLRAFKLTSAWILFPLIIIAIISDVKGKETTCPQLPEDNLNLTQEEFIDIITAPCRYDKQVKPPFFPMPISVQLEIGHMESANQVEFTAHMVAQYRFTDERLAFATKSPGRQSILGQKLLKDKIWVPHLFIKNEKSTTTTGLGDTDIFIAISPQGNVTYSFRMTTTFYCWMDLKKFPFDQQRCSMVWSSWIYNTDNMTLQWDHSSVKMSNINLVEFVISATSTSVGTNDGSFTNGPVVGNFSELSFTFDLRREIGYYVIAYYLPSVLMVCTSWVTFWLQADAGPPRATLGTSTILAFVTLNVGLVQNLPKVSYIKASDIWFLGCSIFIFSSLAEFAFVNVIWRRKKMVELRSPKPKHILKGALTPSMARADLRKVGALSRSSVSVDSVTSEKNGVFRPFVLDDGRIVPKDPSGSSTTIDMNENSDVTGEAEPMTWTTMTPQEVAIWIDKKARIVFPCAFLIFNACYWMFVCLQEYE